MGPSFLSCNCSAFALVWRILSMINCHTQWRWCRRCRPSSPNLRHRVERQISQCPTPRTRWPPYHVPADKNNSGCIGLTICAGWETVVSQRIWRISFWQEICWPPRRSATNMSASALWKLWTLTQRTGKLRQLTAIRCGLKRRKNGLDKKRSREKERKAESAPLIRQLHDQLELTLSQSTDTTWHEWISSSSRYWQWSTNNFSQQQTVLANENVSYLMVNILCWNVRDVFRKYSVFFRRNIY